MYERFRTLIDAAVADENRGLGKPTFKVLAAPSLAQASYVLERFNDAPAAYVHFLREVGDGAGIGFENDGANIYLHSANDFVHVNESMLSNLQIAESFYDVASLGGCGGSLVIDMREGPLRGAVFDFNHELPDEIFENDPLAESLPAFLERVARNYLRVKIRYSGLRAIRHSGSTS